MNNPFISIKNLKKTFNSGDKTFEVLKDINLEIQKGDIFGIMGFSGAGKSTLIRCINRLENTYEGSIRVGKYEVEKLSRKELTLYRRKVGIIFQQFNLLDSKTVFQNVAFALEIVRAGKCEIEKRTMELLDFVGIADKRDFYPGQLSGGQKQRVGIARALANSPDVLLSDEATSALDPITSMSVLDLLKDINKKLGVTIILITHELDAIKYACKNMAVLEMGQIIEKGSVYEIFLNPKSKTAQLFMKMDENLSKPQWDKGEGI
jgi:D-methionine transport system ATP-binding protein